MKKLHLQFASAALLGVGLALANIPAASAASPLIAGMMAGSVSSALDAVAGTTMQVEKIDSRRHHRRDRGHRRGGGGVFFNFGGGSGGFSFGVSPPPYRYYERDYRRRYHQRDYRRSSASAHISWCYNRYRSYRQWDNSFQPYHGPRQQCISPYY